MGNIIRKCLQVGDQNRNTTPQHHQGEPQQQPLGPHGVTPATAGVAALAHDLLNFEATNSVPEGLNQHVTSSKKAQANWYNKILETWKDAKPPPRTAQEAARLVANALRRFQNVELEGILAFYGFPTPIFPEESSDRPSTWPKGVQFALHTMPINAKAIVDGDGFTAYVDTTDPRESSSVPLEVHEAVIERTQARAARNYKKANALHNIIVEAGYRVINGPNKEETLAKKYRIRLRGIDAPEGSMPYGEESKKALVNLIAGKSVKIFVYEEDQYGRLVSDIYCNDVFIQEQMLKRGFAWHYKAYDKRPEFAEWEREARTAHRGLWASSNPEKPWEWRRDQRNALRKEDVAVQVY